MESASADSAPSAAPAPQPRDERLPTAAGTAASCRKETNYLRLFSFAVYMTQAVINGYLPLYFLDRGYSASQIGIIYSLGPFVSIFATLLFGAASDKYRTVKKVLVLLLFGQLVVVSLLFATNVFGLVCLIMLLLYFCMMPMYPLTDSLILLSGQTTGTPYSLVRIFGSLGFAFMAFAMGQLLKIADSGATLVAGIGTIGFSFLLSFKLKDYRGSMRKIEFAGFFRLIRRRETIIFFAILLVVSIAHRMYDGFLTVTMREMGAGDSLVGIALLIAAASEIPSFFLIGKYGHKFKELPLLAIACLMYAIRFFLISQIDSPLWMLPVQAMHSVSFGIFFATALRYLLTIIPDEYRSSGQAVFTAVWSGFAGIIAGTAGGPIFELYGRDTFYLLAMALALIAGAGFLIRHATSR